MRVFGMTFVCVLLLSGCGTANAARATARGNDAYAQQAYDVALASYTEALEARPALPPALYNLGNTHYRLQEGELAQRTLESAAGAATGELSAQAWYNLGNVRFAAQDYAGAVEAYKEALRRVPDDMDAKVNLELALRRLQENEEQQDENQEQETPTPTPTPEEQSPPEGEATPTATPTAAPSATPDAARPPDQSTPAPTATPTVVPTATPVPPQESPAGAEPGAPPAATLPADAPPPTALPGALTAEQARRILEAAAGGTQTLQEALQGTAPPDESVEKDW